MNKQIKAGLYLSLLAILFGLSSCLEDSCAETRHFIEFEALYAHPDDFRTAPEFFDNRKLEYPGKIYYYNDMIMINEKYEGIHIYDNTDPTNPNKLGFMSIPGNLDVAIRDNTMYADSYIDLLTIDIDDLTNPIVKCRDEEVFTVYDWQDDTRGYYVGTRETNRSIEVDCSEPNFGSNVIWRGNNVLIDSDVFLDSSAGDLRWPTQNEGSSINSQANSITGVGGSFARFSVIEDYLYVINTQELVSYNLQDPTKPQKTQTTTVDWDIETLFPYESYLFIGGSNGMFIYDRATPEAPSFISSFRHAQACDPVFVQNDIAYVTLRNGTRCQGFANQLDVIDISNIRSPQLIESFEMENPHGLAVRDNNIYICDGEHGLKVYENDDLNNIDNNRIEHIKDIHAYDAISLRPNHLLIIGNDGLYQLDSSDPSDLELLSFLPSVAE